MSTELDFDLFLESQDELGDMFTAELLESSNAYAGTWGSFGTFGSAFTCASSAGTASSFR
jgi:hypothetical protein